MSDDYAAARQAIRDFVRRWFTELCDSHPDERFYALSFCFHDDFVGQLLSANTIEAWEAQEEPDAEEYTWNPGAWEHQTPFEEAWDALEKTEDGADNYVDRAVQEYRAKCIGATIEALKDLADEGLWRRGKSQVFVFMTIWDSADCTWLQNESARRINPPELYSTHPLQPTDYDWIKQSPIHPRKRGELGKVFHELFGEPAT